MKDVKGSKRRFRLNTHLLTLEESCHPISAQHLTAQLVNMHLQVLARQRLPFEYLEFAPFNHGGGLGAVQQLAPVMSFPWGQVITLDTVVQGAVFYLACGCCHPHRLMLARFELF